MVGLKYETAIRCFRMLFEERVADSDSVSWVLHFLFHPLPRWSSYNNRFSFGLGGQCTQTASV
jgi:hypothetical protein